MDIQPPLLPCSSGAERVASFALMLTNVNVPVCKESFSSYKNGSNRTNRTPKKKLCNFSMSERERLMQYMIKIWRLSVFEFRNLIKPEMLAKERSYMDRSKVEALYKVFVEKVRPILKANGRNNIEKVSQYFSRNVRSNINEKELAVRLLSSARHSRKDKALVIWASDLKVIYKEQAIEQVVKLIQFYKKRSALTESERAYYEELRKVEVTETFGGDIA